MKKLILAVTVLALTLSAGITMGADMIAGNPMNGANVVGTVDVSVVPPNLVVVYTITNLDWIITETHLHVGTSPADFPKWPKDPPPGQFAYSTSHEVADNMQVVTHTILLTEIFDGGVVPDVFYVAAHAVVGTLCPCEELILDCLPDEVMVSAVHATLDFDPDYEYSYFVASVSGIDDTCLDDVYDAWCIDTNRAISPIGTDQFGVREYRYRPVPQRAEVYLSLDCALLPDVDPTLVEDCDDMDLVLWILNNPELEVGDTLPVDCGADGPVITFGDIQRVIWELLNDDTEEDGSLGDWSQCRVDAIRIMAETEGEGFEPICTEDIGLILLPYVYIYPEGHAMAGQVIKDEGTANGYPGTGYSGYPGDPVYPGDPAFPVDVVGVIKYQQPILIMVPVPCCYCDETAWAGTVVDPATDAWPDEDSDGYKYEFPGKNWAMYFTVPEDPDVAAPTVVKGKKK